MIPGALYPGLYALGGTLVEPPPFDLIETVTSDRVDVLVLATATAVSSRSLVTSLFVDLNLGVQQPEPRMFVIHKPGVRQIVTSTVVEGWKKP